MSATIGEWERRELAFMQPSGRPCRRTGGRGREQLWISRPAEALCTTLIGPIPTGVRAAAEDATRRATGSSRHPSRRRADGRRSLLGGSGLGGALGLEHRRSPAAVDGGLERCATGSRLQGAGALADHACNHPRPVRTTEQGDRQSAHPPRRDPEVGGQRPPTRARTARSHGEPAVEQCIDDRVQGEVVPPEFDQPPTAEHLAATAFTLLQAALTERYGARLSLSRVRLYETPNAWADAVPGAG